MRTLVHTSTWLFTLLTVILLSACTYESGLEDAIYNNGNKDPEDMSLDESSRDGQNNADDGTTDDGTPDDGTPNNGDNNDLPDAGDMGDIRDIQDEPEPECTLALDCAPDERPHVVADCLEGTCVYGCEEGFTSSGDLTEGCLCPMVEAPEDLCDDLDNDCNGLVNDAPRCGLEGICFDVTPTCQHLNACMMPQLVLDDMRFQPDAIVQWSCTADTNCDGSLSPACCINTEMTPLNTNALTEIIASTNSELLEQVFPSMAGRPPEIQPQGSIQENYIGQPPYQYLVAMQENEAGTPTRIRYAFTGPLAPNENPSERAGVLSNAAELTHTEPATAWTQGNHWLFWIQRYRPSINIEYAIGLRRFNGDLQFNSTIEHNDSGNDLRSFTYRDLTALATSPTGPVLLAWATQTEPQAEEVAVGSVYLQAINTEREGLYLRANDEQDTSPSERLDRAYQPKLAYNSNSNSGLIAWFYRTGTGSIELQWRGFSVPNVAGINFTGEIQTLTLTSEAQNILDENDVRLEVVHLNNHYALVFTTLVDNTQQQLSIQWLNDTDLLPTNPAMIIEDLPSGTQQPYDFTISALTYPTEQEAAHQALSLLWLDEGLYKHSIIEEGQHTLSATREALKAPQDKALRQAYLSPIEGLGNLVIFGEIADDINPNNEVVPWRVKHALINYEGHPLCTAPGSN